MTIALEPAHMNRLFPNHMVVDLHLTLLRVGDGLCSAIDGPRVGEYLLDYFHWSGADPVADFARIAASGEFLRLACKQDRALLDGTAVPIANGYLLAVSQIPAMFSIEDGTLQMSDFGLADSIVSGLLLVALQRALLDESSQMAAELAAEREKNVYVINRGRRFAGYTAHDFNNLLSIIKLNATRIEQAAQIPDDVRRRNGIILETAERGSEIARSLMTLSNQKHDSPQIIAVDALLAEQRSYFEHLAGRKADVMLDLHAPGVTVKASTSGLINSVINLVINARQAMPDGGMIAIGTTLEPAAFNPVAAAFGRTVGNWIVITVSDTGYGMTEQVIRHAFEPFFSTKPHGSGMGLASVREFAREMGGDACALSNPGAGATIRIHLPAIDAATGADAASALPAGDKPAPARGTGISVLLVEDEPYALDALSEMLESMGFVPTCATSVEEGRAHLESRHFDILLTDVKLHEASGIDLASLAWRDRLVDRVILMSGYVPDEDTLDSAWQFVRKPLDVESLVHMMRANT